MRESVHLMKRDMQIDADLSGGDHAFHQQLRAAHIKITRPRLLVLDLLHELKGHYSADEIAHLLQERHTPLPRASVYNVLDTLLEQGLVTIADAGPGRTLYEEGGPWHHHFVCLACGTVINIPCVKGEKPCLLPDNRFSGIVEEAQIIFRGYCETCAAQLKNGIHQPKAPKSLIADETDCE